MAGIIQDEKELDRQLGLILANRLVFQSREEFAEYAHFQALLSNNPISKMPYSDKVELLGRLTDEFLDKGTGYISMGDFLGQYDLISEFYRNNFLGKNLLKDSECAEKMAYSLFHSHQRSGERKLDIILEKIYDFDIESSRGELLDFELLILMVLGVVPPMNIRGPKTNPDYRKEWEVLRAFLHRCDRFKDMFERNPLLEQIEGEIDGGQKPLNRLSFLYATTNILRYVDRAARPVGIDKDMCYLELDGLWQNYIDGKLSEKNVYYQFVMYVGSGYNFVRYELFPTQIVKTSYHGQFQYDGDELVFFLLHPKGGYETIMGKPLGENHQIYYTFERDDVHFPTKLTFHRLKGGEGFDLHLDKLMKMPDKEAECVEDILDSSEREVVDKYARYNCIYPIAHGIYAITKTHLYVMDPEEDGHYFKVPKDIDEYLDTVDVDDVAGVLTVGEEDGLWIGFEPIALYLSPEQCEENGVERVNRID